VVKWRTLGSGNDRKRIPIGEGSIASQSSSPTLYSMDEQLRPEFVDAFMAIDREVDLSQESEAILRARALKILNRIVSKYENGAQLYAELDSLLDHVYARIAMFSIRLNRVNRNAMQNGVDIPSLMDDARTIKNQSAELSVYLRGIAPENQDMLQVAMQQQQVSDTFDQISNQFTEMQGLVGQGFMQQPPRRTNLDWSHKPKGNIKRTLVENNRTLTAKQARKEKEAEFIMAPFFAPQTLKKKILDRKLAKQKAKQEEEQQQNVVPAQNMPSIPEEPTIRTVEVDGDEEDEQGNTIYYP